jgi:hypothetical protein
MQAEALFTEHVSNPQGASGVIPVPEDASASLAGLASGLAGKVLGGLARRPRNVGQPKCLLGEALRSGEGLGPVAALEEHSGKLLVITLEITDVVERTGLTVSIWGSDNQSEWDTQPLLRFRQRQYCGVYSVLLNMSARPDIRYLRVGWSTSRWGKSERVPAFGFKVFVEESGARVRSSAVA